jgi:hypothetical protein
VIGRIAADTANPINPNNKRFIMLDLLKRLRARYQSGEINASECYHAYLLAYSAIANELEGE